MQPLEIFISSEVYATTDMYLILDSSVDGSMWNQYSIVYVCISHCIARISCILRVERFSKEGKWYLLSNMNIVI